MPDQSEWAARQQAAADTQAEAEQSAEDRVADRADSEFRRLKGWQLYELACGDDDASAELDALLAEIAGNRDHGIQRAAAALRRVLLDRFTEKQIARAVELTKMRAGADEVLA